MLRWEKSDGDGLNTWVPPCVASGRARLFALLALAVDVDLRPCCARMRKGKGDRVGGGVAVLVMGCGEGRKISEWSL